MALWYYFGAFYALVSKDKRLGYLSVCLSAKTLTLALWKLSDRAFICVYLATRPFYWNLNFFNSWPWPKSLSYFLKPYLLWYVIRVAYVCFFWRDLSTGTLIFDLATLNLKIYNNSHRWNFLRMEVFVFHKLIC
jgi:hypothetical protein